MQPKNVYGYPEENKGHYCPSSCLVKGRGNAIFVETSAEKEEKTEKIEIGAPERKGITWS